MAHSGRMVLCLVCVVVEDLRRGKIESNLTLWIQLGIRQVAGPRPETPNPKP